MSLKIDEEMALVGKHTFRPLFGVIPYIISNIVVFPFNTVLAFEDNQLFDDIRLPGSGVDALVADSLLDDGVDGDFGLPLTAKIRPQSPSDDIKKHGPHRNDVDRAENYY